jgi:hypothetical protein
LSSYTYQISDDNVIEIWFPSQELTEIPVIRQDLHPEGRQWADKSEAEAWVLQFIANQEKQIEEPVVE